MTSTLDVTARRAQTTARSADAVGPVRIEASGTSSDAVVADIGRLYDGREWQARTTDHAFAYRYSAVGDHDVTLRRSQIGGHIRGAIPRSPAPPLPRLRRAVDHVRRGRA